MKFFFHFQNNLVLTGKYKEVNRTDTSPLNKVRVPCLGTHPIHGVVVGLRRVDLAQKESGLRSALLGRDVPRHGEPKINKFLFNEKKLLPILSAHKRNSEAEIKNLRKELRKSQIQIEPMNE